MKGLIISLIMLWGSLLFGQSDSLEKAILFDKLKAKEMRQDVFAETLTKWKEVMKEIGGYPDIPMDQNNKAHYNFLYEFPGILKDKLFARTLEWLAINYGLVPAYIYSNQEDGKIIFRNNVNLVTGNVCTYTSVITIRNEKILMEIINIGYQSFYEGHYSNDTWVPEKTIDFGINQVYPIILKKPASWYSNISILRATNAFFKTEKINLLDYILTYDNTYGF
jgi:hypothetical protein